MAFLLQFQFMVITRYYKNFTNVSEVIKATAADSKRAWATTHCCIVLNFESGIRDVAASWLQPYLSNRQQFVKLGRYSSVSTPCSSGVPPGSVLAPLLFGTYVSPVGELIGSSAVQHRRTAVSSKPVGLHCDSDCQTPPYSHLPGTFHPTALATCRISDSL
jgi:hypothetical protein